MAKKPIMELSITKQQFKVETEDLFGGPKHYHAKNVHEHRSKRQEEEEFQSYINLINYDGFSPQRTEVNENLDFHDRFYIKIYYKMYNGALLYTTNKQGNKNIKLIIIQNIVIKNTSLL